MFSQNATHTMEATANTQNQFFDIFSVQWDCMHLNQLANGYSIRYSTAVFDKEKYEYSSNYRRDDGDFAQYRSYNRYSDRTIQ